MPYTLSVIACSEVLAWEGDRRESLTYANSFRPTISSEGNQRQAVYLTLRGFFPSFDGSNSITNPGDIIQVRLIL